MGVSVAVITSDAYTTDHPRRRRFVVKWRSSLTICGTVSCQQLMPFSFTRDFTGHKPFDVQAPSECTT